MMGWQWHQLDHMQIICTSLQTDNHATTSLFRFYRPDALPAPNQQCQSSEGTLLHIFTTRRSYASAVLGVVILSIRLSHTYFVTNPKNLSAIFLYDVKGQSF